MATFTRNTKAPEKPKTSKPKATPKRTVYRVANMTAGPIIFPRRPGGDNRLLNLRTRTKPLIIEAGHSVEIDAEEWIPFRKNFGVQNYIDAGLLKETTDVGFHGNMIERTSNPPVPEHLLRDDEPIMGNSVPVSAKVVRRTAGQTITVD